MTIFNAADYLIGRKRFKPQEHTVEDVKFELIPLTDELLQELKLNDTYSLMLDFAAEHGVSIGRNLVCDDDELSVELKDMWELEQFEECAPSFIHQVGLLVCEISGISEFVEDQKKLEEDIKAEEEKENNHIDGNDLPPGETELDNLATANLERDAINNAA